MALSVLGHLVIVIIWLVRASYVIDKPKHIPEPVRVFSTTLNFYYPKPSPPPLKKKITIPKIKEIGRKTIGTYFSSSTGRSTERYKT